MHRREFLGGAAALASASAAILSSAQAISAEPAQKQDAKKSTEPSKPLKLGIPGPYPGKVVEVRNKALVRNGVRSREEIRKTFRRGLMELTGASDHIEALRLFVQPGECVGIKVVPNGHPGAPTSPELVLELIDGLKAAGIKLKDMVVFDRYRLEFMEAGYQKILPDGVAWGGLTPVAWDPGQLSVKFEGDYPLAGYDPDEFVQLTLVGRGQDPNDDRSFRSHLGQIVTKRLDKIIGLPCIKDHHAAGVTGALKNMSHGLVNNVFRSHSAPDSIAMNAFIPAIVSHPIIRKKCVLHVMDGTKGVWEGGPFGRKPEWIWDYNALLFSTDPVAMDHVEWDILDAKRKEMKAPVLASTGKVVGDPFNQEGFDVRQPHYVIIAGQVGLGNFDYKSPKGRSFSFSHKGVNLT